MNASNSMRRKRRIGIAMVLLGLLPLLVFAAAVAIARYSGGAVGYLGHDLRTYGFYAESVGFAETSPSSMVSVRLVVNRRDSMTPRIKQLPWWVRREFSLRGELERGDTKATRALTDGEMSAMLKQHAPRITAALTGMFQGAISDVPTIIGEMARSGQTRREVSQIIWRNIPVDILDWLGGWWRLCLYLLIAGTGAVIWLMYRAVPAGHCLWCGYDVRGIPPNSPCPECGNPVVVERATPSGP